MVAFGAAEGGFGEGAEGLAFEADLFGWVVADFGVGEGFRRVGSVCYVFSSPLPPARSKDANKTKKKLTIPTKPPRLITQPPPRQTNLPLFLITNPRTRQRRPLITDSIPIRARAFGWVIAPREGLGAAEGGLTDDGAYNGVFGAGGGSV